MNWFRRLLQLHKEETDALQQAQRATDQQRLDNMLRRNRGCYICGAQTVYAVETAAPQGWEPIKWYACQTHYPTLHKAVNEPL